MSLHRCRLSLARPRSGSSKPWSYAPFPKLRPIQLKRPKFATAMHTFGRAAAIAMPGGAACAEPGQRCCFLPGGYRARSNTCFSCALAFSRKSASSRYMVAPFYPVRNEALRVRDAQVTLTKDKFTTIPHSRKLAYSYKLHFRMLLLPTAKSARSNVGSMQAQGNMAETTPPILSVACLVRRNGREDSAAQHLQSPRIPWLAMRLQKRKGRYKVCNGWAPRGTRSAERRRRPWRC